MRKKPYLCTMKRKRTDIDRMVMESHYLESLERESSPSLSDMERQDYIDQINELRASNRRLLEMIDTLKQTLDTVSASSRRNEELVKRQTEQIEQLQKMIRDLQDRNNRHNKNTFGKRSLKKNKRAEEKPGREEEKEDYDGNHDTQNHEEKSADDQIDQTKVKSEHLDGERAKRENYTKMNAAKVTSLLCDTTNIPTGMRLIGFKEINEFDKISYIECISYQVAILEDEFGVRHEYFVPADAEKAAGRPFTVSRKNSLHYSSEEGVEMAMTYLTIIETAKMWGLQIKEYLAFVWHEVMSGNTNYEELIPEVVIARQNC